MYKCSCEISLLTFSWCSLQYYDIVAACVWNQLETGFLCQPNYRYFILDASQANRSIDTPLVIPVKPLSCGRCNKQANKQTKQANNKQTKMSRKQTEKQTTTLAVISLSKYLNVLHPERCVFTLVRKEPLFFFWVWIGEVGSISPALSCPVYTPFASSALVIKPRGEVISFS